MYTYDKELAEAIEQEIATLNRIEKVSRDGRRTKEQELAVLRCPVRVGDVLITKEYSGRMKPGTQRARVTEIVPVDTTYMQHAAEDRGYYYTWRGQNGYGYYVVARLINKDGKDSLYEPRTLSEGDKWLRESDGQPVHVKEAG